MQHDVNLERLPGSRMDRELVDLALSVNSAVRWSFSFTNDEVTWMPGMAELLAVPGADEADLRARLLRLIEPLTQAARTTPVWQDLELEQPLDTPTGQERLIRFRARRYSDQDHDGLVGVAAEVSSSGGDSQALADLADRYRLLVELSPDAICVHQDGLVTYVNPATVRFVAAESDDQILGHSITEFIDRGSIPAMQERIAALTTPGATSEPAEAWISRLDGGRMLVESVSVRTTWQGRPAYQVIMRDITAQREAERTLHYQAALVQHVSDAIIATTRDGTVTSWNPAAEDVYGVHEKQAVGRNVGDVVGARLDPEAVHASGGVAHAVHRRADGSTLIIRISAAEMNGGFVLVCADETARRRAEQHFSTVVEALDEGVVVVGVRGRIESANPAARLILGVAESDIVGSIPWMWALFDESGAPIPKGSHPSIHTQRTGQPLYSQVVQTRRPDGRSVWLALTSRALNPEDAPPYSVVLSFTDITERRAIQERLEQEATHDPLTGLANRTLVLRRLSAALHSHRRDVIAVLFVDLDQFKVINDSLGHGFGDKVLRIVADRLRRAARDADLVGRLGGDEFLVIAQGEIGHADVRTLADLLRGRLTEPIVADGRQIRVDASVGIVLSSPGDPRAAEDVLRDADVAMYQAKAQGRGRHVFFDVELRERLQRQMHLEQDLRDAVRDDQLWMAYQPIVDVRTGRMVEVEGLLRWTHPVHGTVPPAEFIPLAEDSDLINSIGAHMLRLAACELAAARRQPGFDLKLNVNLSTRQLEDPLLIAEVRDVLRETGLPPHALGMEVTESAFMRDSTRGAEILEVLRGLGVSLAIDDFGTGYSSLAQLQRFPLDTLKIDRTFVSGLGSSRDAEVFITSIIAMAHAIDLTVVAEGVETSYQLEVLRELGCDLVQGYYLGKPATAGEIFGGPAPADAV